MKRTLKRGAEDAAALRTAMKGFGTDEKVIIAVLANRSSAQRQAIAGAFKTAYGKDLVSDLKSELGGNLENVVVSLMFERIQFLAHSLRYAMKGAGTEESVLIEIICTATNDEIHRIKAAYSAMFQRDLEKDIESETSGHFRRLLISLLQCRRAENAPVDMGHVTADVQGLIEAGVGQWGTDESKFNEVLVNRSFGHLYAVFKQYAQTTSSDILRTIDHEMSGSTKKGFKAVVYSVVDRPGFFAERLYDAMHGAGTDDESLIRIIVSRCEVDTVEIKQAFMAKYQKTLDKMIGDECSGDYKRILIDLINN